LKPLGGQALNIWRILGIGSSVASAALSVFALVLIYAGEAAESEYGKVLLVLMGAFVLIVAYASYLAYLMARYTVEAPAIERLKQENTQWHDQRSEIAIILHNLSHEARNVTIRNKSLSDKYSDGEAPDQLELQDIIREFLMFNLLYLDNTKALFDRITGFSTAVSIKIIDLEDGSATAEDDNVPTVYWLRTFMRDTTSYRQRRETDMRLPRFSTADNTAFSTILNDDTAATSYVCNDLSAELQYQNKNRRWREFYNATLVSPIRIDVGRMRTRLAYIGFLAIDSKKGTFEDPQAAEWAHAISDLYYMVMQSFVRLVGTIAKQDSSFAEEIEDLLPANFPPSKIPYFGQNTSPYLRLAMRSILAMARYEEKTVDAPEIQEEQNGEEEG